MQQEISETYLMLRGVVFRIPDREALVLPSNFVSADEIPKPVARAINLTLCARLPEIELRGDREARRGCLRIGYEQSDWIMVDADVGARTNPEGLARGQSRNLKRRIATKERRRMPLEYVEGSDFYDLHSYQPQGEDLPPSTETLFWRGVIDENEKKSAVETLIECTGSITAQSNALKGCKHTYILQLADVPSWSALVTLHYSGNWLPQWAAIEEATRKKLLSLRVYDL